MRYFIPGAAGFVGRRLIQKLLEVKNNVILANSRSRLPFSHERLEFIESDIFSIRRKLNADVLIHLIGSPGVWFSEKYPEEDYHINAESLKTALEITDSRNLRKVVFASTCQVYGSGSSEEHLEPLPQNEYGRNKLKAEALLREHCKKRGIPYSILRMSWIYGPGMKKNPIYDMLNNRSYLGMDSTLDFIFVDDVCEALIAASEREVWNGKTVNISSGEATSLRKIRTILYQSGFRDTIKDEATLTKNVVVNNHLARSLGWHPIISVEKGVWKTYEGFEHEKEISTETAETSCHVCGKRNVVFFMRKNDYDIFCCHHCGVKFVWPQPHDTAHIYSENYFLTAKDGYGYADYDKDKKAMTSVFMTYLSLLERAHPQKGELLDIGTATGFFLELARERGWRVAGLEISDYAASLGRNKGLDIKTGKLEEACFEEQSFDAITLLDVFEHVQNPSNLLRLIHKLLKPNGFVMINTPDARSCYARIFGKKWHAIVPPEHLFYFNKASLNYVLCQTGFKKVVFSKINKKFRPSYILSFAGRWTGLKGFQNIADSIEFSFLNKLAIAVPLYDNMLSIAQKCRPPDRFSL